MGCRLYVVYYCYAEPFRDKYLELLVIFEQHVGHTGGVFHKFSRLAPLTSCASAGTSTIPDGLIKRSPVVLDQPEHDFN